MEKSTATSYTIPKNPAQQPDRLMQQSVRFQLHQIKSYSQTL